MVTFMSVFGYLGPSSTYFTIPPSIRDAHSLTVFFFALLSLSLVEILDVVVQHHLLSNFGVDDVDGVDRVVDVGRPRQDEYAPEAAKDDEEPEEEPVQHHGNDAPVLILLWAKE